MPRTPIAGGTARSPLLWLPMFEASRRKSDCYKRTNDCTHPRADPFLWEVVWDGMARHVLSQGMKLSGAALELAKQKADRLQAKANIEEAKAEAKAKAREEVMATPYMIAALERSRKAFEASQKAKG